MPDGERMFTAQQRLEEEEEGGTGAAGAITMDWGRVLRDR